MKTVQPGRVAGAVPAAEQRQATEPGRAKESQPVAEPGQAVGDGPAAKLGRPAEPGQPGEQGRRAGQGTPAGGPAMMRAITQRRYGTVPGDVLGLGRTATPTIAANEVLLRVRAAGVDQGTWYLMAGQPYLMRLLGFGFRGPKNRVPGMDVAGTVVAAGADVTRFRPGDEVFGIARGSFAEYAAARESKLASKPAGLSFDQAAVIAVSGLTALQGLRDAGHIQAGQKVLIVGASGGVGSYAVQLAKVFGAHVTGVCRTAKTGLVASIGADHVIDYTREDFADGSQRYDLILDIGGSSSLARLRRALTPTGTLVIAGGERAKWTGAGRQLRARMLSLFVPQRLTSFLSTHRQADLETLRELAEAGRLTPAVSQTFPLSDAPAAIACLAGGQARGKIAITI
jgi:NADPH:quinone reductase-like Zn-dependent oxidoreductase